MFIVLGGGIKIPTPSKFSRKRGTLVEYIRQVKLYIVFYIILFQTPKSYNLFYLLYLKGDIASSLKPQFNEYIKIKSLGQIVNN